MRPPAKIPGPDRPFALGLVTLLTALALAVHGYHPYSEDGGLYIAGVKHLLEPTLYPHNTAFVEAHLRFSLFAPLVAGLVRLTHLGLPTILLSVHLASIWMTLYAAWLLAAACISARAARAGATTFVALWLTLPIAGTSLILLDPYLTARSLSLPCTLLALAALLPPASIGSAPRLVRETWAKRTRILFCLAALAVAAAMHPLMAAYALGDTLLFASFLSSRPACRQYAPLTLCAFAFLLAAVLHVTAPPEPPGYLPIALSRYYWFLSRWHWYELLGLAAPLALLAATALRKSGNDPPQALARTAITSGTTAILIALAFAHEQAATHLVARLQPLRTFQMVYVILAILLGGWLGERILRQTLWRWAVLLASFGGLMFYVQRDTYPASSHIEWPGAPPANQWQQAFLWISRNTPKNALFALDADYTAAPGEDTQGFRALAERSALPDYSKDGGEAAITPTLTAAWTSGQTAQAHLSDETDASRLAALRPLNVTWVVLQQHAQTVFDCPYRNPIVKVCRLPQRDNLEMV